MGQPKFKTKKKCSNTHTVRKIQFFFENKLKKASATKANPACVQSDHLLARYTYLRALASFRGLFLNNRCSQVQCIQKPDRFGKTTTERDSNVLKISAPCKKYRPGSKFQCIQKQDRFGETTTGEKSDVLKINAV